MPLFKKENNEFRFAAATEMKCNGSVIVIVIVLTLGKESQATLQNYWACHTAGCTKCNFHYWLV
jgi:hypothetical protein